MSVLLLEREPKNSPFFCCLSCGVRWRLSPRRTYERGLINEKPVDHWTGRPCCPECKSYRIVFKNPYECVEVVQ